MDAGRVQEAVGVAKESFANGMRPDSFTAVRVLTACGRVADLATGEAVRRAAEKEGIAGSVFVATAAVDLHVKCGETAKAREVFDKMQETDAVAWGAMVGGYASDGHPQEALDLLFAMQAQGVRPDCYTVVGALSACTRTVDWNEFLDNPAIGTALIDLYANCQVWEHRGGMGVIQADEEEGHHCLECNDLGARHDWPWEDKIAFAVGGQMDKSGMTLNDNTFTGLLGSCTHTAYYVVLSNIYSISGRWEDAAKLRLGMKAKGVEKVPAYSWVQIDGKVHEFRVGDKSHPLTDQIYKKLDEFGMEMKTMGYKPTTKVVMFDVDDDEEEHTLVHHSEKLPIAFSLLTTESWETTRVTKNLRVFSDCHTAIKLISRMIHREFIVRDNNRFHCFRDGWCSFNDYW